jgi:hypothetical protein
MANAYGVQSFRGEAGAAVAYYAGIQGALYKSGPPVSQPPDITLYTECNYPGYGRQALPWPPPVYTNFPDDTRNFAVVAFTAGTVLIPQNVAFWAVLDALGKLIYLQDLITPLVVTTGTVIHMAVQGYFSVRY